MVVQTQFSLRWVCFSLAVYMTATQILSYFDNKDTSSIEYIRFNESLRGTYPTFSVCFRNSPNDNGQIFPHSARVLLANWKWFLRIGSTKITTSQFESILKWRRVLALSSDHMGTAINMTIQNISTFDIDELTVKLERLISAVEFVENTPNYFIYYGDIS